MEIKKKFRSWREESTNCKYNTEHWTKKKSWQFISQNNKIHQAIETIKAVLVIHCKEIL